MCPYSRTIIFWLHFFMDSISAATAFLTSLCSPSSFSISSSLSNICAIDSLVTPTYAMRCPSVIRSLVACICASWSRWSSSSTRSVPFGVNK